MLKLGVDLRGLKPQMAIAYTIASFIYLRHGQECVITSASDSKHGPNSLHYQGLALDIRTYTLPIPQVATVHRELKIALGEQFDVVLEDAGNTNQHVHIEFQPKEPPKAVEA
jgi:hypothetical protein